MPRQRAIAIRPLAPGDRAAWEPLWQGYLAFYRTALSQVVTDTVWRRFHDPAEPMFALGAFADGRLVGFAHYLFHRATFSLTDHCYLEDLFVAEDARRLGAGRALIGAVMKAARRAGSKRVYWHTEETNRAARALYDSLATYGGTIQYRATP
jgi:GNAT superfamily N-acetyltransferase